MHRYQISVNSWTIVFGLDPDRPNKLDVESCYRASGDMRCRIDHPLTQSGPLREIDGDQCAELLRSCLEWRRLCSQDVASHFG